MLEAYYASVAEVIAALIAQSALPATGRAVSKIFMRNVLLMQRWPAGGWSLSVPSFRVKLGWLLSTALAVAYSAEEPTGGGRPFVRTPFAVVSA